MKKYFTLITIIFSIHHLSAQYQFVSPKPGSVNLPPEHNIILRPGSLLDATSIQSSLFTIQGTKSGLLDFKLILCDDGKTINLNPIVPLLNDDTVVVTIAQGLATTDGAMIGGYSFSFTTHSNWTGIIIDGHFSDSTEIHEVKQLQHANDDESDSRSMTGLFTINVNSNPAPGTIFFDSRSEIFQNNNYTSICAIANDGDSVFQRTYSGTPYDFQLGKNGYFDSYRGSLQRFDVMDSNFCVIDSYKVVNGFRGDPHELSMLANGYAFITGQEYQQTSLLNGNDTSGLTLIGSLIQEFDPHHNIIFEWRSFDHVDASEADHLIIQTDVVDLVHTNSIEVDADGNILVSHRHLSQITKIDVNTGEFIWRLGGVKNEFTFTNDSDRFYYQHDCRRLANGNITLYDDGNYHVPPKSYAKEYHLDEVNKTATVVWSYSHPDVDGHIAFYPSMGSTQRLPNGNTFIGWGWRTSTLLPDITEVDPGGNIVWELTMTSNKFYINYRAHKYLWEPCARPTFDSMSSSLITDHSVKLSWMPVANPSEQYELQHKKHDDTAWISNKISSAYSFSNITGLEPSTQYDWRIQSWCDTTAGTNSHFTAMKTFTTLEQSDGSGYYLMLYPNPANDEMTIECSFNISRIRLVNLLGQEVKNIFVSENGNQQFIEFSISNLNSGNYLMQISGSEENEVRKLIIE